MRRILAILAILLGLGTASHAQNVNLNNLGSNTVVGRLGSGIAGPAQAIPISNLLSFALVSSAFDTSFCSTVGAAFIRQTAGWMCSTAGGTDGVVFGAARLNTSEANLTVSNSGTALGTFSTTLPITSPLDWRWTYSGAAPTTQTLLGPNFYTVAEPSTSNDNHEALYSGINATVYSSSSTTLALMAGGNFNAIRRNTGGGGSTNPIIGVIGSGVMGVPGDAGASSGDGVFGGILTAYPGDYQGANAFDPQTIAGQVGVLGRVFDVGSTAGSESTLDNVGVAGYVNVEGNTINAYGLWSQVDSRSHTLALATNVYGLYINDIGSAAKNLNMAIRTGTGTVQFGGDLVPGANVVGNIDLTQLGTPTISSVQSGCDGQFSCGGGGSKTYTYKVVAVLASGATTPASSSVSTSTGFDDLSRSSQNNLITWSPVEGAVGGYNIYRTAAGGSVTDTTGKIANVPQNVYPVIGGNPLAATTPSYADAGATGDSTSPPTTNTTGILTVSNYVQLPIYTIANLPSCASGTKGAMAFVSDTTASGAATFHGTVSGSGASTVNSPVSCNGSNWQYD